MINSLAIAGAESMLSRLAVELQDEFEQLILCLIDDKPLAGLLLHAGIPVQSLGVSNRAPNPLKALRLAAMLRRERPDIVQTWLPQSDLLGGIAARCVGIRHVVWNLRGAHRTTERAQVLRRAVIRVCARLSTWVPDRIVCCASSVQDEHAALGYDRTRMLLIRNGVDVDRFKPSGDMRRNLRIELGVSENAILIGLIARWHPQKDHLTFMRAARKLREKFPDVRFVLAGKGLDANNAELSTLLKAEMISDRVHLLGERVGIEHVTAGLDIATLTSWGGEGFPNAIAEAMACGVPCVATRTGDAPEIVGDTGLMVAPRSPAALCAAWAALIDMPAVEREALGLRARNRIISHFSMKQCAEKYRSLYRSLIQKEGRECAGSLDS